MTLELTSSPPTALRPFEDDERLPDATGRLITALIVGVPFLALVVGVVSLWGRGIGLRDVLLAISLYFLTGHGMTIGFHRLLAHKSFSARRPLKIVPGRSRFDGVRGWADQLGGQSPTAPRVRRHRRRSPFPAASRRAGELKGLWHAHVGWLFTARSTSRRAPRGRPAGRPRHRGDRRAVPVLVRRLARLAVRSRMAARGDVRGGAERPALGRPGPDLRAAPRDVERQLGVPHVRPPTVCHQGPQHQRRRARRAQHGRVVAQQPSRLPTFGPPRSAPPAVGFLGAAHPGVSSGCRGPTTCTGRPPKRFAAAALPTVRTTAAAASHRQTDLA